MYSEKYIPCLLYTSSLDDFTITYFTKGAGIKTLSIIIYTERKLGNQPELYACLLYTSNDKKARRYSALKHFLLVNEE